MHKSDCPNVALGRDNPENEGRWVDAYWEEKKGGSLDLYEAQISKAHIHALFNSRNESEVIVDPKYLTDITIVQDQDEAITITQ